MAERNYQAQVEHMQTKFVGTGHADITRHEWLVNIQRDSLASYIGHPAILSYLSIAENESLARMRYVLTEKMLQPCGPAPKQDQQESSDL